MFKVIQISINRIMADKSVFGWIASTITLLYKLPQIYKIVKKKSSADLSSRSIVLQATGYIFYAVHGYVTGDMPILVMGTVALLENGLLGALYLYYRNKTVENVANVDIII